jgi:N-acetylglucosaminyl-diphospho-decaprenol L-rhamnosyltransferase
MRTALITIAAGRHLHLRRQHAGVVREHVGPDLYLCVSMGDPATPALRRLSTVPMPSGEDLPLAAARNLGAGEAIRAGAELLIFLDVDCIPSRRLVLAYRAAAAGRGRSQATALCGSVRYLPPLDPSREYRDDELGELAAHHPDRVITRWDASDDVNLFWSLSFAMTAAHWQSVGGFDERYTGYGGEDTDFAQKVAAAGGRLLWVPDAVAYHQHHESHDPPLQHVRSIVRNANTFRARWGWFPMLAWLHEFERLGLARFDRTSGRWHALGALACSGSPPGRPP